MNQWWIMPATFAFAIASACGNAERPITTADRLNSPAHGEETLPHTTLGRKDALHGCRASRSQPPAAIKPHASIWKGGNQIYLTTGGNQLFRFESDGWNEVPIHCDCEMLTGVFGTGPNDVYVSAYYGTSFHFDGATWSPEGNGFMHAVWASDPKCIVMVGETPQVRHFEGVEWNNDQLPEEVGARSLFSVWGANDKNIIAVGDGGLIIRHAVHIRGWGQQAEDWGAEESGTQAKLRAVWGTAENDTFAVGDGGAILHWDGVLWTSMKSGTNADLAGIGGTAKDDVFAVGAHGTVLHFDGHFWTSLESGTKGDIYTVTGAARGSAIVAGADSLFDCTR